MAKHFDRRGLLTSFVTEFLLLIVLGVIVGLLMSAIRRIEPVRNLDREVTDSLMKPIVRDQLQHPDSAAPGIVFLNISEEACEHWAEARNTSCTLGMVTPRNKLSEIVGELDKRSTLGHQKPSLVVIDVDIAPLPQAPGSTGLDDKLCRAIVKLAGTVPIIVVRPEVVLNDTNGTFIKAYPTVLSADPESMDGCRKEGYDKNGTKIWFASALLKTDADGKVRSVHAWDTVQDPRDDRPERVAGIGFLAAALLDPRNLKVLACLFPGSTSEQPPVQGSNCKNNSVEFDGKPYEVPPNEQSHIDRIMFLLPFEEPGPTASFPFASSLIDTVDIEDFVSGKDLSLLGGAVVVIGGSYRNSGDLHATPLGFEMPGAMIHANALRAYASGRLVREEGGLGLEALLIAIAALVGAGFHVLSSVAVGPNHSAVSDLARIPISILGIAVSGVIIFSFATAWVSSELASTGTALGVVAPALAIALEGFCGILNDIRGLVRAGIESPIKSWTRHNGAAARDNGN